MVETGHFASLWNKMAHRLGIKTEFLKQIGKEEPCLKKFMRD